MPVFEKMEGKEREEERPWVLEDEEMPGNDTKAPAEGAEENCAGSGAPDDEEEISDHKQK